MSSQRDTAGGPVHDDPAAFIADRLGEHRDVLERLAELDTELSDDARRALDLLEGGDQS